jgi:hypothetical protein
VFLPFSTVAVIDNSQRCYGIFSELVFRLFELLLDQVVEDIWIGVFALRLLASVAVLALS